MFRGVNYINLDTKGRMAIPTRYRAPIMECCDGKLVVTIDFDKCLLIYPLPEWQEVEAKILRLPNIANPDARALQRIVVGHASEYEMDGNGRILLPQPLREIAQLDKRAVLVGQINKFELWDEGMWNAKREQLFEDGRKAHESVSAEFASLSL